MCRFAHALDANLTVAAPVYICGIHVSTTPLYGAPVELLLELALWQGAVSERGEGNAVSPGFTADCV